MPLPKDSRLSLHRLRGLARRSESRYADIIDNTKATGIDGAGIVEQHSSLSPRDFHIQDGQVAFSRMSLDFHQTVSSREQKPGQLNALPCEQRYQLVTESQTLLDGNSEVCPHRVAQSVGQRIHWMIHVEQNLGDGTDVHNRFEKAENVRKRAPTLNNCSGADSVQRHVGYSRQHDEEESENYRSVHNNAFSSLIALQAAPAKTEAVPWNGDEVSRLHGPDAD